MRRSLLFLILFFIAQSLTWAQDNSQPAQKSQDTKPSKATVYVYRYKQFVGAALSPSVYCDDVQLARMENGRYFAVSVDSGTHVFRSNDAQSGIQLQTNAGEAYFVRVEIATGFMKGHGRLVQMSREQGSYELTSDKLKPLDAGKVMDKSRVSVEGATQQAMQAARTSAVTPVPAVNATPQATAPVTVAPASATTESQSQTQLMNVGTAGVSTGSRTGDQISLGDAARLARQKKQGKK